MGRKILRHQSELDYAKEQGIEQGIEDNRNKKYREDYTKLNKIIKK